MANWLERAQREIPAKPSRGTAKTAERSPTAVTAVHEPDETAVSRASNGSNGSAPSGNFQEIEPALPMTTGEEAAIRAWLASIEERDEAIIGQVVARCRADADARRYFIARSAEAQGTHLSGDDRRRCVQCANLTGRGLCLAARRGEILAGRDYEPVRDVLRRCEGYAPGPDDLDRRPGRNRWPGLSVKGSDDA